MNSVFLASVRDLSWKFGTFGSSLQNNLFQQSTPKGMVTIDLLAMNINRGRDHGLQPYVKYVQKCLNITINIFADLSPTLMNAFNAGQLQKVYGYFDQFKIKTIKNINLDAF